MIVLATAPPIASDIWTTLAPIVVPLVCLGIVITSMVGYFHEHADSRGQESAMGLVIKHILYAVIGIVFVVVLATFAVPWALSLS